jgi:hypothetical protein
MLAGRAERPQGGSENPAPALSQRPSIRGSLCGFKVSRSSDRPSGLHLVAGFGRIIDLKPAQFLTGIGDAADLLEAEHGAVEHMNEDHREAMNLYATRLLGQSLPIGAAPAATLTVWTCRPAARALRLDFPERVTSAMALRKMLVRLAGEARAKG